MISAASASSYLSFKYEEGTRSHLNALYGETALGKTVIQLRGNGLEKGMFARYVLLKWLRTDCQLVAALRKAISLPCQEPPTPLSVEPLLAVPRNPSRFRL
jgi:hypothetical protein